MTEKIQSIPARIKNIAKGGHVAGTEDIIDDASGKTQKEINTETGNKVDALQKQDIEAVTSLPAISSADPKKIYRVAGETSYTDYMLNAAGTQFVAIATYSFPGIDDEPTAGSDNLVKSGGTYKAISLVELQNYYDDAKNILSLPLIKNDLQTNRYYYFDENDVLQVASSSVLAITNSFIDVSFISSLHFSNVYLIKDVKECVVAAYDENFELIEENCYSYTSPVSTAGHSFDWIKGITTRYIKLTVAASGNTAATRLSHNASYSEVIDEFVSAKNTQNFTDSEKDRGRKNIGIEGIDTEPILGSRKLITSGAVFESMKPVVGTNGAVAAIATINYRLQNNTSDNYGYWYDNSQRSLIFDLSDCKGKSIVISRYTINNTYNYCIVSDYLTIPSSYNPTVFDPLVLLSGDKTWDKDTLHTYTVDVPNTSGECYLIVSVSTSHVNDVSVFCQANAIEPLSNFKEEVYDFMLEHKDDVKQEDISLTGTNYLGVMPAKTHRIASANVGSALAFGGSSGYQSSHEYLPVQEGEIYYLMYGYNNVIHAAVTDDNNIVVAAYTESIYYAGLIRVEIPQGGKFLTWTTAGGSTLGWYVKVIDKKYDNYLLYDGEVKHYTPTEIQTASTDVVCAQSKHLVNGINMIDCEMNGTTSKIVIPVDYTKECKKGFYLYIDPSQISKITGVAVNGLNLSVYSTFSYQDCFYLSVPIAASTSKIEISLTLAEGVTDDVIVAISSQMDVNKINKAVVCVNFDSTWQSSVDCGAYDYIFNTAKLPVTIVGAFNAEIYDFEPLLANGMLELATYGGNQGFEQQCSHITEGCSMAVLNQHLDVKEDYYQDTFKIQPRTFGGRQHQIDRKIIFALTKYGYHSSRMRDYDIDGGANYGGVIINGFNIVSRIKENSGNGGVGKALERQAAINFFAHGLSTDGTGDAETKWSTFKTKIDFAMQNVNNGGMIAMTFEQYYQTLKRFGLVANVC